MTPLYVESTTRSATCLWRRTYITQRSYARLLPLVDCQPAAGQDIKEIICPMKDGCDRPSLKQARRDVKFEDTSSIRETPVIGRVDRSSQCNNKLQEASPLLRNYFAVQLWTPYLWRPVMIHAVSSDGDRISVTPYKPISSTRMQLSVGAPDKPQNVLLTMKNETAEIGLYTLPGQKNKTAEYRLRNTSIIIPS